MKTATAPLFLVPFSEVRHDQPDDCLHYEPIRVRGQLHDWTIPAHRHEGLHQFQLLHKGSAHATIDGQPHALAAPAALMLAPGSVHEFRYARDSEGHQITIPSETLRRGLQGAGQLAAQLGQSFVLGADALGGDEAACTRLFDALGAEFREARPGRVQALLAQATLVALWFLRHQGARQGSMPNQALRDTLVQRFRQLLEQHFSEHRPLAYYAAALQVTPDHLSRVCRALTGASALDMLHARLMLQARRMLAYTPMTVAQIAHALGYDDAAYFSKFFARRVGEPPSAYRESIHRGVRLPDAGALPASGAEGPASLPARPAQASPTSSAVSACSARSTVARSSVGAKASMNA